MNASHKGWVLEQGKLIPDPPLVVIPKRIPNLLQRYEKSHKNCSKQTYQLHSSGLHTPGRVFREWFLTSILILEPFGLSGLFAAAHQFCFVYNLSSRNSIEPIFFFVALFSTCFMVQVFSQISIFTRPVFINSCSFFLLFSTYFIIF